MADIKPGGSHLISEGAQGLDRKGDRDNGKVQGGLSRFKIALQAWCAAWLAKLYMSWMRVSTEQSAVVAVELLDGPPQFSVPGSSSKPASPDPAPLHFRGLYRLIRRRTTHHLSKGKWSKVCNHQAIEKQWGSEDKCLPTASGF
jgi:hypothetical protein